MYETLRYAAFTSGGVGGNPAGVVLDAAGAQDEEMLRVAAEIDFSETAFVLEEMAPSRLEVRYFSPQAEVNFFGHATVATAVAWAERKGPGDLIFETKAGEIPVRVRKEGDAFRATLTSVPTRLSEASAADLAEALRCLRWSEDELDSQLPPRIAFGGVEHLVLAVRTRERLSRLDYDFEALGQLMRARGWTTLQLVWREMPELFHARDPFPVGGVVEDPATGAAAAAFGGYVRDLGLLEAPARFTIRQGEDMGRPSELLVEIPAEERRIRVSGVATAMHHG